MADRHMNLTMGPLFRKPASPVCRRTALKGLSAVAVAGYSLAMPSIVRAKQPVTFGLTPVFLDSDLELLDLMSRYFSEKVGHPVQLVKRRTYQEITAMLLTGEMDAAWICGYPFVRYRQQLSLMGVPVYQGKPLYQSYLIVNKKLKANTILDLKGKTHAFSDPDSNSGFLVTRALLAGMDQRPDTFFAKNFFTYGHRNVIRAVAAGLAESGSVDGYVWDVIKQTEPELTRRTRVIRKSQWLGFPPVACNRAVRNTQTTALLTDALLNMSKDAGGREILSTLHLDGFQSAKPELFNGIAKLLNTVNRQT